MGDWLMINNWFRTIILSVQAGSVDLMKEVCDMNSLCTCRIYIMICFTVFTGAYYDLTSRHIDIVHSCIKGEDCKFENQNQNDYTVQTFNYFLL